MFVINSREFKSTENIQLFNKMGPNVLLPGTYEVDENEIRKVTHQLTFRAFHDIGHAIQTVLKYEHNPVDLKRRFMDPYLGMGSSRADLFLAKSYGIGSALNELEAVLWGLYLEFELPPLKHIQFDVIKESPVLAAGKISRTRPKQNIYSTWVRVAEYIEE